MVCTAREIAFLAVDAAREYLLLSHFVLFVLLVAGAEVPGFDVYYFTWNLQVFGLDVSFDLWRYSFFLILNFLSYVPMRFLRDISSSLVPNCGIIV